MSDPAPYYEALPTPPESRIETFEQLQRASKYAAELVDLTTLVGWWLGVGQYAYTIERLMGGRTWGVVRRRTMEVVGEFPTWPAAMKSAMEHGDACI